MDSLQMRIDKWLWMVRVFKTRTMATDACNAGKVKFNGQNVKPSRDVKINEIFVVKIEVLEKTIKVLGAPKSRVGAALVPNYCADLTTSETYENAKLMRQKFEKRDHGVGRPTKRDRRQIDFLKDNYAE